MLVLLAAVATGAVAQNYTITLPSVSNGSVSAKVNDASVTSAEAGATVSLVATPYAGYRLKTISGTYQGAPEETFQKGAAMREGTYFRLVASANNNAGWRFNTGSESTITITSKQEGTLIDKVELSITTGVSFNFNTISVSSGTKTINGNVITITGINNTTLTITGTGNAAQGCTVQSATITGTTEDKALTLTSTGDDNVKTFTMPSGNVTISAEFEPAPAASNYTVSLKEGTDDATSWKGKAGEGDYQELPLEGVAAGTAVSVKYNGTKKVKSVKAKKKAAAEPAGPTAYTLAESTQGMIVGTDGKAYDVADLGNLPTGVTAAGVVVYKNGANGLAIALTDEASTMYWSTANGETGAAAHTPTVTGYSWRLPSMDEWKQMFGANGGNNESYTGLNTAINTAGGTALLVENGIYWTCTETAYSGHYIAFLNANVSFFMDDDNNANRIRACIAF